VKALQREQRRLGERVRALRLARGWTQESAAETIAISVKQLRRLEQGQANVTLATLVALAAGFRVGLAELFTDARG
jgi:transcriptional regulator with XRE-family HTH domain